MEAWKIIAAAAIAGFVLGFAAQDLQGGESYCQKLEDDIRQNKTFNGSISCYPPSAGNFSGVSNRTEVKCICSKSYLGNEQTFAVTVPK